MTEIKSMVVPIRWIKPELYELKEITYAMQARDEVSGIVGYFFYDDTMYLYGCGHYAISPVFEHLEDMYTWAKSRGFSYHCNKTSFTMCRDFPTSVD